MLKPGLIKTHVLVFGSPSMSAPTSSNRRYSVVFFSTSVQRATKLANLLSVAGIRVHHASSAAEVRILLEITSDGVVLVDQYSIGSCGQMLRELAADFPEACTVVLSPFDAEASAQLYAEGAWEVVVEPARLLDLLAALESAYELNRELRDPVRLESRVDAIISAFAKWRKLTT
jgi:DNA-binding NtrC family response regulator